MPRVQDLLRFWFGLHDPVPRGRYFRHGAALMACKYAADTLLVWLATGHAWRPWEYVNPVWTARAAALGHTPAWLGLVLAVWTLPFLWIGVALTLRRLVDAGRSPWLSLLFFVPYVNYALMLTLSLLGTAVRPPAARQAEFTRQGRLLREALAGIAAGLAVSVPTVLISVFVVKSYSTPLFLGTPFSLGAITAYFVNRRGQRSLGDTLRAVVAGLLFLGGVIFLFAIEGAVCLLMALPLALVLAGLGAVLGRAIARLDPGAAAPAAPAALMVLVLPALTILDARAAPRPPHDVVTTIDVAAPAERVWANVVRFPDLAPPTEWLFRAGVAYPERARIEGSGAGAIRYCEFSTGAFVEPITEWRAPRRLAFDITSQPATMVELSPYHSVQPAHLHGYFRATHGQFDLLPLPGGGTRLVGTTRYDIQMYPQAYWSALADAIVGRIHARVLRHIKELSER
jgi:uncharacterized membrane protein YhaH (DUF805 family)